MYSRRSANHVFILLIDHSYPSEREIAVPQNASCTHSSMSFWASAIFPASARDLICASCCAEKLTPCFTRSSNHLIGSSSALPSFLIFASSADASTTHPFNFAVISSAESVASSNTSHFMFWNCNNTACPDKMTSFCMVVRSDSACACVCICSAVIPADHPVDIRAFSIALIARSHSTISSIDALTA